MQYDCPLVNQNIGVEIDDLRSEVFVEVYSLAFPSLLNVYLLNFRISRNDRGYLSQPLQRGSILFGATQY